MSVNRQDTVWQDRALVEKFLGGVRAGIPFAAEQIDVMLRVLRACGRPVRRFADVGCGDGALAQAVLSRWPDAQAVLVDFSEPMLEQARKRLHAFGEQVAFVPGDIAARDWAKGLSPFDAVVSGFCIHHQPDARKREIYREIYDLLQPGGCFVNVEHVASPSKRIEEAHNDLFIDALSAFHARKGQAKPRETIARDYVHRPDRKANILASAEDQCRWLREAGFGHVDCYFKCFELAVFGGMRPP